jgi:hypothetical protein
MDRAEWLEFAVEHLRSAHKTAKSGLYESRDSFRGLSPYDRHDWYIAAKGMINAITCCSEIVSESNWLAPDDSSSPAYFIQKLEVYANLAGSMIKDLDGYAESYRQEFDVQGAPELLLKVRDQVLAFKSSIDEAIEKAPDEVRARLARA